MAAVPADEPRDAPLAAAEPVRLACAVPDFERVFREFAPYVLRVLPRLGVAERDLDDVAQDVFWAVHRGLPRFEGRSSLKTWLYGICIRVAANYRARAHRRHEQLVDEPQSGQNLQTPARDLDNRRALAALDAALGQLPDVQRAVFVLHEVEALAVSEIAEALACSKFTIYARLYAARRTVQSQMGEHGEDYGRHD